MIRETDSIKIARIDEKVVSLKDWAEDHDKSDTQRFERLFCYVRDGFDKLDGRLDKVDSKIDLIWDDKTSKDSASRTWKYVIGGIGTLIVTLFGILTQLKLGNQ